MQSGNVFFTLSKQTLISISKFSRFFKRNLHLPQRWQHLTRPKTSAKNPNATVHSVKHLTLLRWIISNPPSQNVLTSGRHAINDLQNFFFFLVREQHWQLKLLFGVCQKLREHWRRPGRVAASPSANWCCQSQSTVNANRDRGLLLSEAFKIYPAPFEGKEKQGRRETGSV